MRDLLAIWSLSRTAPPVRRWRLRAGALISSIGLRRMALRVAGQNDLWFGVTLNAVGTRPGPPESDRPSADPR